MKNQHLFTLFASLFGTFIVLITFKVALNLLHMTILNFQEVALYHANRNSIIINGGHRA